MSIELVLWILTAFAALVVVLTRVRVVREAGHGPMRVGYLVLGLHTAIGALAVAVWVTLLLLGEKAPLGDAVLGIVAVALWWLTSLLGLLIGTRWKPSGGRHSGVSSHGGFRAWFAGPGLSLVGQLGLIVAVAVFTWAYLTSAV